MTPSSNPTRRVRPGRLILRTSDDAEFEHVITHRDARVQKIAPASGLDRGGALDRLIRRYSPEMRVTRAFYARQGLFSRGGGHLGYDAVEHELGLSRTFRISIDPDADVEALVSDLAALSRVEMAAPHLLCETPFAAVPSSSPGKRGEDEARAIVGASEALSIEPGDSALIIGLIDSGVDFDHPELTDRLRPGVSSVGLKAERLSDGTVILTGARKNLQDVGDDEGHGTACAGILVANGIEMPRGLAGAARLLPIRALCGARMPGREQVSAIGSVPDIDSGLKTAIDLGARVLNLSFGTPERSIAKGDPVPHVEVVRYALARDCVLVAASGNSGLSEKFFPAALPGVIAVGAIDAMRRPARFTTRGDHVALSAPGERVVSSCVDGYSLESGTSFAAPLVTAACALLLSRAARSSVPLTPARIRDLLLRTATPFGAGATADGCGAGVLNVPAALRAFDAEILADAEAA